MTVPKNGAKYNAVTCPPYQVTHTSCQAGKMFTGSKHRVTFAFGFANPDALQQGLQGPEARGEEHEVKLVWSHTSGKRQVIADNQEVHFSVGKKLEPRFETSWTMEGGHTVKLVAHASQALFNTPGFRQFELFLDGMSYFSMPKIYELGQSAVKSRNTSSLSYQGQQDEYGVPEGRDFAQAPTRSVDSSRRITDDASEHGKRPSSVGSPIGVADLPNAQTQDFFASQDNDLLASIAPPEVHPTADEFSPVEATGASPSFLLVTNQIMSAYSPMPSSTPVSSPSDALVPYGAVTPNSAAPYTPPSNVQHNHYAAQTYQLPVTPTPYYEPSGAPYTTPPSAHQPYYQQAPAQQYYSPPQAEQYYSPPAVEAAPSNQPAPAVKLTMAPLTVEDMHEQSAAQLTGVTKAFHSLVNLDDINETIKSPEDRKFQQKKEQAHRQVTSKPLPPKQANWSLGLQPNLQAMKEHAPQKSVPTKEIMRTHAFDPNAAQAGMMVAYGTQPAMQPQPMMMHSGPCYYHH